MSKKPRKGRKVRVDFRRNRQPRPRESDLTRAFHEDEDRITDAANVENVRAKGELSRKRTIIVDDEDLPQVEETQWQPGVIIGVHGRVCRVQSEKRETWDCSVRRVLRTLLIAQRAPVTVGDRVWISDQSRYYDGQPVGVIERVGPRTTTLSRKDRRGREHTIVANADQLLVVASIAEPSLKPHLIDRYLVAAAMGNLRPIIALNKCDLGPEAVDLEAERQVVDDENVDWLALDVDDVQAELEELGYRCIRTSATTGEGVEPLRNELRDHMTVLSGQSGVGKSSLINALQPGLGLLVGEVSEENQKGRHTTTLARLLPLDFGGFVVDTPGIRKFELWAVEPGELEGCFVEFHDYIPQCRFRDCHHLNEEGCAVRAAADEEQISPRRYESYVKMVAEMAEERRTRYGD